MNLFDIVGPVMVGPSSSHTAGATKIGLIARRLLGEDVKQATIFLHGSFLKTGKGHGTDKAIVAGLLMMDCDDTRIPESFDIAKERGLEFEFKSIDLGDVHPNTAKIRLKGINGKIIDVTASSLGGGRIEVIEIDEAKVRFSGEFDTLIIHNEDRPGVVNEVTGLLGRKGVNIATMQVSRENRGGVAIMVIECDDKVFTETLDELRAENGVISAIYVGK